MNGWLWGRWLYWSALSAVGVVSAGWTAYHRDGWWLTVLAVTVAWPSTWQLWNVWCESFRRDVRTPSNVAGRGSAFPTPTTERGAR